MKSGTMRMGRVAAATILLAGLSGSAAFAAGTVAGTQVSNTATVEFTVGGVPQAAVPSTPVVFTVDRKVDMLVAEEGSSFTTSRPGQNDQVLSFLVTNEGNQVQDFLLTATDGSGNTVTFGSITETDDFDATAPTPPGIWVDDGDGVFNSAVDTEVAYLDDLAADGVVRVFIVRNIGPSVTDGSASFLTLSAQAVENSGTPAAPGAALVEDAGANVLEDAPGAEQIVFADDDGSLTGGSDALRDGIHSAVDGYIVRSSQITISKSAVVVSDPFGAVAPNAKSIPGSIVEYTIVISNAATASESATGITISDDLSSEMSGAAGGPRLALSLGGYGVAGDDIQLETNLASVITTTELTATADADSGEFVAEVLTVDGIVLAPGDSATVRFRVEIQ
jgi:hypothetical protein